MITQVITTSNSGDDYGKSVAEIAAGLKLIIGPIGKMNHLINKRF